MTIQGEGVGRQGQVVEGLAYATAQPRPGVVPIAGLPVPDGAVLAEVVPEEGYRLWLGVLLAMVTCHPIVSQLAMSAHHHVANELIDLRGWIR